MYVFFNFFSKTEEKYTGKKSENFYSIEKNRFIRRLTPGRESTEEEISDGIVSYINFLDSCIQYFFSHTEDSDLYMKIDTAYNNYSKQNNII